MDGWWMDMTVFVSVHMCLLSKTEINTLLKMSALTFMFSIYDFLHFISVSESFL